MEEALEAVVRQGLGEPAHLGPKAPTTFTSFPKMLQESQARGFSLLRDVHAVGTSAMAALSGDKGGQATGVVVIAGSVDAGSLGRRRPAVVSSFTRADAKRSLTFR